MEKHKKGSHLLPFSFYNIPIQFDFIAHIISSLSLF